MQIDDSIFYSEKYPLRNSDNAAQGAAKDESGKYTRKPPSAPQRAAEKPGREIKIYDDVIT